MSLSEVRRENKKLTAIVLSILKVVSTVYISLKTFFYFHCSPQKVEKSSYENFTLIRNNLPNKSWNPGSLKK